MAEKSGYEIRADILHLAHQIVSTDAHMKYEASKKLIVQGDHVTEARDWTPFTVEQILEVADKLNTFVQKK